jgi:hypothetical protein
MSKWRSSALPASVGLIKKHYFRVPQKEQKILLFKGGNTMTEGTRSSLDRRSGIDRRRAYRLGLFMKYADEKRSGDERRSRDERRKGWVRVDRWSSVELEGLKIAKFLKLSDSKATPRTSD